MAGNVWKTFTDYQSSIINMDETSIYLDFPSNYSYTKKGSRRVKATTSGNERTRILAGFTFSGSGFTLSVYCVLPRVTDLNFNIPENCKEI